MCDPIVTKPRACEDTEATVTLQVEVARGGFSEGLQEYIQSKEQRHEECLVNMRTELQYVNSASDKELEDLIEMLKVEINLLDTEMCECLSREVTGLEQWHVVQRKINNKGQRIQKLLDEFHLDITDLEKTRCEKIKRVLGKYKDECVRIMFLSLESIEQIFEDIIADLNRGTLGNLTHHEDLKLKFRIEGEAVIAKHHLTVRCRAGELADERANELWGKIKIKRVKGLVAEAVKNSVESCSNTKEYLDQAIKNLMEGLSVLAEALEILEMKGKNAESWKDLKKALEFNFVTVNTCCSNLDELLTLTITNIVDRFDYEANALVLHLRDEFGDEIIEEVSLELAELENKKADELVDLQFWQKVLEELVKTLQKMEPFSLDITWFWHNNITRLDKTRLDFEANFESCHQRCLNKEQEVSSKLKTQLKTLREAPDKTKLEASSKILTEIFMGLSNIWSENFEFNTKAIEEFKNTNISLIVQQTTSEANDLLLTKYPKNLWFSQENVVDSDLERNDVNSIVIECTDYKKFIEKKMLDIYEDLEKYVPECPYEISEEYDSLLNKVMKCVNDKNEKVLAEFNSKAQSFEYMKAIRLAELEIHSERFKSHQAGVNMVLNNVTITYEDIKTDQRLKLQEFHGNLTNFFENRTLETRDQIKNAISALEQEWDSLSILLENRILDAKMSCQHKFETLKHSNDSFQKIAKHFKNGGNYSQNELTYLTKELKQLEKIFLTQSKTLSNQYNSLIKDISRQELDSVLKVLRDKLNVVLLNDKIGEVLGLARMKLRSEISHIKTTKNTFISKIQLFDSLGKPDDNLLDEIVSLACSILDDMAFTVPLECEKIPKKPSSIKPLSKKDAGAKNKKPVKTSMLPNSLFENVTVEELIDGKNFLSRVKLTMTEKYLSLTNIIKDTLKPKSVEAPKPKNKEPKQDAESGQITENIEIITQILSSYNKECELIWFDQAKEFIRQVTALRITINELSEQVFDKAHFSYVESLSSTENGYKFTFLKLLTDATSKLNKIRKSILLPLAHPSYQHKLEDLHKQAMALIESQIKMSKQLVCNYKNDLQKKHDDYVERITIFKETLENSQKSVFDTISCDRLTEKLQELEKVMLNQPMEVEKESFDLAPNKLVEDEKELMRTDIEETGCLKYPMSIWSEDETCCLEHESQLADEKPVKKNSIISMATLKLKDSVEKIQRLFEKAEDEAKEYEKEIANCMNNLEYDIKQAKVMFTKIGI